MTQDSAPEHQQDAGEDEWGQGMTEYRDFEGRNVAHRIQLSRMNISEPDLGQPMVVQCMCGRQHEIVIAAARRARKLEERVREYMSQFGQALEAHGIPLGSAQVKADAELRALLSATGKEEA